MAISKNVVAGMPVGSVLQVVQTVVNGVSSVVSTSSSSFVTANLSASITPSSSSNKILIFVNGGDFDLQNSGRQGFTTIYRNSTNLNSANSFGFATWYNNGGRQICPIAMSYLDSPATSSSTTYTVYFRSDGSGTVIFNSQQASVSITLMEIAA